MNRRINSYELLVKEELFKCDPSFFRQVHVSLMLLTDQMTPEQEERFLTACDLWNAKLGEGQKRYEV